MKMETVEITNTVWVAVLIQAYKDYRMVANKNKKKDINAYDGYLYRLRIKQDAIVWFNSYSTRVGSFIFICDAIGCDPSYIRSRLDGDKIGKRVSRRPK